MVDVAAVAVDVVDAADVDVAAVVDAADVVEDVAPVCVW